MYIYIWEKKKQINYKFIPTSLFRGADTLVEMSKEEVKHHKTVRGAYRGHCTQDIKRAERLMAEIRFSTAQN